MPKSFAYSRGTARKYETKFGCMEVVLAVSGSSDGEDRFFVGRLQEDVLMGASSTDEVSVQWYDRAAADGGDNNNIYESHEEVDSLPVGSLVCSVTKFIHHRGFRHDKERIQVTNKAFAYGDTKLAQQMEDDYESDQDSQFGDAAVAKRLEHLEGKTGKRAVANGDDGDEEENATTKKGKRKSSAKISVTKKNKKSKAGRGLTPRPDVELKSDSFTRKTKKFDDFDGDIERASKEVVRAVKADDIKALRATITKNPRLGHLHHIQSVGVPLTGFMWALALGNIKAIELLVKAQNGNKTTGPNDTTPFQACALPELTTGKQTSRHANYNRRKINASRGGREGNNALLRDALGQWYRNRSPNTTEITRSGGLLFRSSETQIEVAHWNVLEDFDEVPQKALDVLESSFPDSSTLHHISTMVTAGHYRMAERYISRDLRHTFKSNAFNFLHAESLSDQPPQDPKKPFSKEFQAKSVIKMSTTGSMGTRFTPLMCACINPNTHFLRALLKVAPAHTTSVDGLSNGLLHYAAACENSGPLEYLLTEHSLPISAAINKSKESPLHVAAKTSRPANVRILLEKEASLLHSKSAQGFSPIHYAVKSRRSRNIDTVKAMLDLGADPNTASTAARNKISPVHLAAIVGDLEILKVLIKHGGNASKGDKLGRSPLIHASMSGHVHVVSYLIQLGVNVEAGDSSDNKPVHYAAAYGWDDCLSVLVADGDADPDPKNSWKTTPLSVAIQKGRNRVAAYLLNLPQVDVNVKDDRGQTLFIRLVASFIVTNLLSEEDESSHSPYSKSEDSRKELPWALRRLLDRNDINVASGDTNGCNFLHLLCLQTYSGETERKAVDLAELIMSRGTVNVDEQDVDGVVPLVHAAVNNNNKLFEFLISKGATVNTSVVDKQGKNICHHLLGSRPDECKSKLDLVEKAAGPNTMKQLLRATEAEGMNPLHEATIRMMSKSFSHSQFLVAQSNLKDIIERFPSLAESKVGPRALFTDAKEVAKLILQSTEEQQQPQLRLKVPASNVVGGKGRLDPKDFCAALRNHRTAVALENEHFGKALIHLTCETKIPRRCSIVLEWLLPLSKNLEGGGRGNLIATPLQTLLYCTLPGELFLEDDQDQQDQQKEAETENGHDAEAGNHDKESCFGSDSGSDNDDASDDGSDEQDSNSGSDGDDCGEEHSSHKHPTEDSWSNSPDKLGVRLRNVSEVLKSAKMVFQASGQSVNQPMSGLFKDAAELREIKAKPREAIELSDREALDALKRDAKSAHTDESIIQKLKSLMRRREQSLVAQAEGIHANLCLRLALADSELVPEKVWIELVASFDIDLTFQTETSRDTALHIAMRSQNTTTSRFLVDNAPQLVTIPNSEGELPLHIAAKLDNANLVKMVLEHLRNNETEVNRADSLGRTAFHFSVERAALRTVEVLEPCEILFIRAGAHLDIADLKNQRNALHFCFLENPTEDHVGFPHTLSSRSHDRVDLASSLLSASGSSAAVKMKDRFGRTPLFYAAAYGSTVSSLLLCSKGSNILEKDEDGNTPINVAVLRLHDQYVVSMLKSANDANLAAKLDDVHEIRREVVASESTGKISTKIVSKTARSIAWYAIKRNFRGLVYILLDSSFPLAQAASDALDCKNFTLARKLFSTSPPEVILHINQASGRSLLHEVASVDRFENVEWGIVLTKLLLESGVPSSSQSLKGQTPLHLAAKNGHVEVAELLAKADASALSTRDENDHLPLTSFLHNLHNLSNSEDDCIRMVKILTTEIASLQDEGVNWVAKTKEVEVEYEGIQFRPGPNRETVLQDMEKEKDNACEEDSTCTCTSTILIQSVLAKQPAVFQDLLRRGALIDLHDSCGLAPLHHAILTSSVESVALVVRNGADVNNRTKDDRGLTPLLVAVFQLLKKGYTVKDDPASKIVAMLLRNGSDVTLSCKQSKRNALHFACLENNVELATLLIRAASHAGHKPALKTKPLLDKDEKYLVRFHDDSALVPCHKRGRKLLVCGESTKGGYPVAMATELFSSSDLQLDSLEALIKLQEAKGGSSQAKSAKLKLAKYYGAEFMVVEDKDEYLTGPLKRGDGVLFQQSEEKAYPTSDKCWSEGWIVETNGNGTYDVELAFGQLIKGVYRMMIRPWTHLTKLPSSKKRNDTIRTLIMESDIDGSTPLITVVKPAPFGSFENVALIELLVAHGAKIDSEVVGLCRQNSEFQNSVCDAAGLEHFEVSKMETCQSDENYSLDSITPEFLERELSEVLVKMEETALGKIEDYSPPINPMSELKTVGICVMPTDELCEGLKARFFDVVMAKVEMNHYGYSDNKYYKMQIIEDGQKGIFVLITNWGQVGDCYGNKQETPFGSRTEAIGEFTKIFKSKTGNTWDGYQSGTFEPKLGKYKPMKVLEDGYKKPKLPDIVKILQNEEDYPKVKRSSKLPPSVIEAMKAFVDPEALSRAANSLGLQQSKLPLGRLSIQTLLDAEKKLAEVKTALDELSMLSGADKLPQKRSALETVAVLSSQFFELLPTTEGDEALKPLDHGTLNEQKRVILGLKDVTVASQIVHCANDKAEEEHPLQYAYRALNASLRVLDVNSPERIGVEQYFRNTCKNRDLAISEVFEIRRFSESSNKRFKNHRLLWHGTNVANMMGVIKEGLRVAPPTAQQSGSAFGNGVYFADMASKSWSYCRAQFDSNAPEMPRAYLLLADVALGEQVIYSGYEEDVGDNADSVLAVGHEGPDPTKDVVFNTTGTVFPLGKAVPNTNFKPFARWHYDYHRDIPKAISEELERLRASPDTLYPSSFESEMNGCRVKVHLEHGPNSSTARIAPVRKRKKMEGGGDDDKSDDDDDDDEQEKGPSMPEVIATRKEITRRDAMFVYHNEYVVSDIERINLKYIVEVTSADFLRKENAES